MGKRKAPDDFSTNKNTKRERKRLSLRSDEQARFENAKRADVVAEKRALKELHTTPIFRSASEDQRIQLTNSCVQLIRQKR
jgi:hypothetical protein